MARFDLYRGREGGFLLDVQDNLHERLATRVVIPLLLPSSAPPPSRDLNPAIEIEGERHLLFPQYMAAVSRRELGRAVGNLEAHRDAIMKALDVLLTGF